MEIEGERQLYVEIAHDGKTHAVHCIRTGGTVTREQIPRVGLKNGIRVDDAEF